MVWSRQQRELKGLRSSWAWSVAGLAHLLAGHLVPCAKQAEAEAICLVYEPPFSDVHRFYKICISTYFYARININGLVSEFSKQVLGEMKEHYGALGKNAPDSKQSPSVMSHSLTSSLLSSPTYSNAILSSGLFLPPTIFHSQTMAMLVPLI